MPAEPPTSPFRERMRIPAYPCAERNGMLCAYMGPQRDAPPALPLLEWNLVPPAQIAPFVVERIGLTQARRLCLTGAQFRGAEALRLGLVHEGFADESELQDKLAATLRQIMHCAPHANALTKQILLGVGKLDMDAVLDDAAQKFAQCVRGSEASEGIAAFMQKRPPAWAQNDQ